MKSMNSMNRRNLILRGAAFAFTIAAVATLTVFMSLNTAANTETEPAGGRLTVNGNAVISVEPDIGIVNIAVVTRGRTTAIQEENNEAMRSVIAAIRAAGVAEADIQTAHYSMGPESDWSMTTGRQTIIGYIVHNSINVTVRNIDSVGEILSVAERAGANEIGRVSFAVSNSEVYYRRALERAIADARAKAGIMAAAAGVILGDPVSITEGWSSHQFPTAPSPAGSFDFAWGRESIAISAGELSISANVTMVFGY